MATTTRPQPTARSTRGSARGAPEGSSETEYDLLTAALIGAAVGAGITLLLHHLPGGDGGGFLERVGKRGDEMVDRGARRGRKWGARKAGAIGERVDGAREALRDTVEREVVRGVRRAILRQRKRLGL